MVTDNLNSLYVGVSWQMIFELNDSEDQADRFDLQVQEKDAGDSRQCILILIIYER